MIEGMERKKDSRVTSKNVGNSEGSVNNDTGTDLGDYLLIKRGNEGTLQRSD